MSANTKLSGAPNLNEILTELSKPVWWASVVVAGIAINLLSAYLKDPLDKALASMSSWWRRRSEARQKAWSARVDRIGSSEEARNSAAQSEIRLRLQAIHLLLLAIFLLVIPVFISNSGSSAPRILTAIMFGTSAFSLFASFLAHQGASSTNSALYEAQRKTNKSFKRTPEGAA